MATLRIPKFQIWYALQFLLLVQMKAFSYQHKVGDLHAWNIPTAANKHVYEKWPKNQEFKIGDSLFFLYPPSEDSVIQVTKDAYETCNLKDPILKMNDGNSLFNITKPGEFYFTSGEQGHCEKSQKLHISVFGGGSYADSPSYGPSGLPDSAPSSPTVFGSIPAQASSSSSSSPIMAPVLLSAVVGFLLCALMRSSSI